MYCIAVQRVIKDVLDLFFPVGTALLKKKKSKWFWPLPVLTYHLVVVCIIVIYLISIVASPALIKTVAPCRRLYCKPVWSFVFPSPPPSGFWTQWKCDVYMYSFSEYSFIFPVFFFLVFFSPRNPCTSAQTFLLPQLRGTPTPPPGVSGFHPQPVFVALVAP